jgi:hypothetical protein
MPRWLNIIWCMGILGAFGFGIYSNQNTPFDSSLGWENFKDFVAPTLALVIYVVLQVANQIIANADLAAPMLVSLLFLSITLIVSSILITEAKHGNRLYEVGLAIAGLALGIPFGEKLRESERQTVAKRQHRSATKTTAPAGTTKKSDKDAGIAKASQRKRDRR